MVNRRKSILNKLDKYGNFYPKKKKINSCRKG